MDITQAAFGLDMQSASRIYFINPVLNPQIEAQAIGRARRISQKKPVTVETLVLRGSLEEVIVRRRGEMSQAEQWKCRSILDDKPIKDWISNAKILPLPGSEGGGGETSLSGPDQMAKLQTPQAIFGRGFGRELHPDQDLVAPSDVIATSTPKGSEGGGKGAGDSVGGTGDGGGADIGGVKPVLKRPLPETQPPISSDDRSAPKKKPRVRVRFADEDENMAD